MPHIPIQWNISIILESWFWLFSVGSWANPLGNLNSPSFKMMLCYCAFKYSLVLGRVRVYKQIIPGTKPLSCCPTCSLNKKSAMCTVCQTEDQGTWFLIPHFSTAVNIYSLVISDVCSSPFRVTHHPGLSQHSPGFSTESPGFGGLPSPRCTWKIGYPLCSQSWIQAADSNSSAC